MKKAEIILALIAIAAFIMQLFLVPLSTLTVLSLLLLSIIYYGFGFALFNGIRFRKIFKKESYKEVNTGHIIIAVGAGIALGSTVVGLMFIFQNWLGAGMMLLSALSILIIVFIITLVLFLIYKSNVYARILKRIFIIGGIAFLLSFYQTNRVILNPELHQEAQKSKP